MTTLSQCSGVIKGEMTGRSSSSVIKAAAYGCTSRTSVCHGHLVLLTPGDRLIDSISLSMSAVRAFYLQQAVHRSSFKKIKLGKSNWCGSSLRWCDLRGGRDVKKQQLCFVFKLLDNLFSTSIDTSSIFLIDLKQKHFCHARENDWYFLKPKISSSRKKEKKIKIKLQML